MKITCCITGWQHKAHNVCGSRSDVVWVMTKPHQKLKVWVSAALNMTTLYSVCLLWIPRFMDTYLDCTCHISYYTYVNLYTVYVSCISTSSSWPVKRDGAVTCHGGSRVAHRRHVGVSWWAHQRGNALSWLHVHVPCGRGDKRPVTNCQISILTSPQSTSCCHVHRPNYWHLTLSLRIQSHCVKYPLIFTPVAMKLTKIHNSLVNV